MSVINEFYAGKKMVRSAEVCEMLGITENTLQNWIKRGVQIPYHQVPGMGRFFVLEEVALWQQSIKQVGPPKEAAA